MVSITSTSSTIAGRRLQNLVDAVVKRSKLSYTEQYASLEVPAVPPPERAQHAALDVAPFDAAAHSGSSGPQSGQSSQLVSSLPDIDHCHLVFSLNL